MFIFAFLHWSVVSLQCCISFRFSHVQLFANIVACQAALSMGFFKLFFKNKKRIVCKKVHHDWPAGSVLSLMLTCTSQLVFRRLGTEMSLCESFQNMHKAVAAPCWDYIPNKLEWLTRLGQSLSNLVKSIYLNSLKCKQDISCCLNNIRVCL